MYNSQRGSIHIDTGKNNPGFFSQHFIYHYPEKLIFILNEIRFFWEIYNGRNLHIFPLEVLDALRTIFQRYRPCSFHFVCNTKFP